MSIAAMLAIATTAGFADDVCCQLYTQPNFHGQKYEACLWTQDLDALHPTPTHSFEPGHFMWSNMYSFKCGPAVQATFCLGDLVEVWNEDTHEMESRCAADDLGGQVSGPASQVVAIDWNMRSLVLQPVGEPFAAAVAEDGETGSGNGTGPSSEPAGPTSTLSACDEDKLFAEYAWDSCQEMYWRCPHRFQKQQVGCGWYYMNEALGQDVFVSCEVAEQNPGQLCHDLDD